MMRKSTALLIARPKALFLALLFAFILIRFSVAFSEGWGFGGCGRTEHHTHVLGVPMCKEETGGW